LKALVTGGAGFIGSNLCDALIARGDRVAVIDNLSTGSLANVEHLLDHPRFQFVGGSILDSPDLERLVRDADRVYHLAAAVGVKYICDDPLGGIITNVHGTQRVLELAHRYGARTVIASSSEVYGKSKGEPLREDDDCTVGPTSVNRWSYACSKALDEHMAFAYAARGLQVSAVRYFNSYGPRLSRNGYGSVVANFIRQATAGEPITVHGEGLQTRSFTFVADTVRGTLLAGDVPGAVGQVFNIGSEREVTILELARLVRELTGAPAEITHVSHQVYYGANYEDTARRRPDGSRRPGCSVSAPRCRLRKGCARRWSGGPATMGRELRWPPPAPWRARPPSPARE